MKAKRPKLIRVKKGWYAADFNGRIVTFEKVKRRQFAVHMGVSSLHATYARLSDAIEAARIAVNPTLFDVMEQA